MARAPAFRPAASPRRRFAQRSVQFPLPKAVGGEAARTIDYGDLSAISSIGVTTSRMWRLDQ
jgi:hypothetical protein